MRPNECAALVAMVEALGGSVIRTGEPANASGAQIGGQREQRARRPKPAAMLSEGARLLWLALEERKWTRVDLESRLRGRGGKTMSNGQADGWLYGHSRPSLESAAQLLAVCGIPIESWRQAPKETFVQPGPRRAA